MGGSNITIKIQLEYWCNSTTQLNVIILKNMNIIEKILSLFFE